MSTLNKRLAHAVQKREGVREGEVLAPAACQIRPVSPEGWLAFIAAPENCLCCGSTKLSKLGEDISETLKVIHTNGKSSSYARSYALPECENFTQPPAPFHVTPPGGRRAKPARRDPVKKFGQQPPKSEHYAGTELISASRRWPTSWRLHLGPPTPAFVDRGPFWLPSACTATTHSADPGVGQNSHGSVPLKKVRDQFREGVLADFRLFLTAAAFVGRRYADASNERLTPFEARLADFRP
jgi:hypothetical protein